MLSRIHLVLIQREHSPAIRGDISWYGDVVGRGEVGGKIFIFRIITSSGSRNQVLRYQVISENPIIISEALSPQPGN